MSDFSFTSTAECEACGAFLSSSDEDCDHDGQTVKTHVFRRLRGGRDSLTGVEATMGYKWYALSEKVGDDWIAYQWLGTRQQTTTMLNGGWSSVEELPTRATSINAPRDAAESED